MEFELVTNNNVILQLMKNLEIRKRIGELNKMQIWVYNREGENIPHFHIKIEGFPDTCLKITNAEWFIHGNNNGILYRKCLKELYNWLCKNDFKHWKEIIDEWNKHCINKIDSNLEIPNYLNLI